MKIKALLAVLAVTLSSVLSSTVFAADHAIAAGSREFKTPIIYIQPGDHVRFTNMNSHNSVSVEGMIPEGATPWTGNLGENINIVLTVPGIYSYVCQPHIGFGMVGVIVVGPATAEDIAAYKQKAMDTLQGPYRRLIGKINKIQPQP